jgi:HEAT repeat protein
MRTFPLFCALALCGVAPLANVGSGDTELETLLKTLESGDDKARLKAMTALADLGPKAGPALDRLIKNLYTKDEDLRLQTAIVLGKIGKKALPALIEHVSNENSDVRYYAVWAIALIGADGAEAQPTILKALDDPIAAVKRKAAYALGRIQADPKIAVPALIPLLRYNDQDIRSTAADSLARFGDKAVPDLIKALAVDNKAEARAAAVGALTAIGEAAKDAIPALKDIFLASDPLAGNAAIALARIGKASLPVLVEGSKSDNASTKRFAVDGLGILGGDGVPALIDVTGDKDANARSWAVSRLVAMRIADKSVVIAFAYLLKDTDDRVRFGALGGLQIAGPAAAPALTQLIEGMTDKSETMRWRCALVLGRIGPAAKDAVPALTTALDDPNPNVRNQAKQALKLIEKK